MQVQTAISDVLVIFMGPSPDIICTLFEFLNIKGKAEALISGF
jgi:hypothetical protein